MDTKTLVEGTPYLDISAIKQDILRSRKKERDVSGIIDISYGSDKKECNYWFEYKGDSTFIVISVDGNDPQEILISERELLFGTMNYFVCSCKRQCRKLYLPSGQLEFKCRYCYDLVYELSTINRSSLQGKFLYKTNRTIKLANQRFEMNRIFYGAKFTHRYERFLKCCARAGLNDMVQDAQELMNAIKAR